MRVPSSYIKRTGLLALLPVILALLATSPCKAQDSQRLPDSLDTEVDKVPAHESSVSTVRSPDASEAAPVADTTVVVTPHGASFDTSPAGSSDSSATPKEPPSYRYVPPSVKEEYKRDKDFEYANDPDYWLREKPKPHTNNESGFWAFIARIIGSEAFKLTLYALLAVGLGFALYKIIAENNLHLFYRSPQKARNGTSIEVEMDMDEEDLEKKIQESLAAGDHRTATRYLFLKALRLLKDRGLIAWHAEATNQEYIDQMNAHPQGKSFRFLANAYEHIWYGNFLLTEEQSAWLVKYFQDFYKATGNK
ncbi:MAG TPA: DUF4129 domain-containing protein [Puia sp.]|nr:DUF4129 domain-containing protein [Puia sp.]